MAHHEISPGQIKGLLLLLVLGPLIPTALMLRLMVESVRAARTGSRDAMEQVYQQSMAIVAGSLARQWETAPPTRKEAPGKIVSYFRGVFDPSVNIRLVDERGNPLSGDWPPKEQPAVSQTLDAPFSGWKVQLFLRNTNAITQSSKQDIAAFAWPAAVAILANLIIAGSAGFALHRQIKIHELKNSTLSTVAHELKTPVASMRLLLDTLTEGRYRSPDQFQEYLELASRENARLSRLIENFLAFSRIEGGNYAFRKTAIDPNEAVLGALDAASLRLNGARVETRLGHDLPPVRVDRDSLNTVIVNLLENAWKYSGDEKQVVVETRRTGDCVVFVIEDHGIGIAREEQPKIFGRFYQIDQMLSRHREGCGLGLNIVKHIVEGQGGAVTVESELGKGSRFLVSLPAAT